MPILYAAPSPPFPPPLPPRLPSPPTDALPPPRSALPPPSLKPPTDALPPPPTAPSPVPAVESSQNLALGVGLGVGLGLFALIVLPGFTYYLLRCRRRNNNDQSAGKAATDSSGPTSRDVLPNISLHKGATESGMSTLPVHFFALTPYITLVYACDRAIIKRGQGQTIHIFLRGQ